MLSPLNASVQSCSAKRKTRRHPWVQTVLVLLACLSTAQWGRAQCTVTVTTNPPSPLLVGQPITVNASITSSIGQSTGEVELDGAVLCPSLSCSQALNNVAEGIHTLGWNCTSSAGNNSGTQQLVVGRAFKQFLPSYFIWSLLYAAPGNQSQNGFTDSTTTGTSSAVNQSFQQGNTVTFGIDFKVQDSDGDPLFTLSAGGSVGASKMDAHALNFTELITSASGTAVSSAQDPLSHYQDRFFIWVNPMVTVFQTADAGSGQDGVFVISLPEDSGGNILPPGLVDVTVAELLNPAQIPLQKLQPQTINGVTVPGLASICAHPVTCTLTNACGCVPSDFATIVQQDPLVFDPNNPNTLPSAQPTAVDPNRYFPKQIELLEGPDCPPPTCPGTRNSFTVTDSTQVTNSDTITHTYSVGESDGISIPAGLFTIKLGTTSMWQWSNAVTQGNSTGKVTQAAVTFSTSTPQCSENYNVYEDALFHTFTFAPASATPACLTPIPDFNLVAFPPSNLPQTILNGGSATYLVSSVGMLGFTGTEALSVSGMPAGMQASFNPPSFNLSPTNSIGTSILTISATSGTTPEGDYPLNVIGAGGGLSHSAPIQINVQDFVLSVTPNSPNTTTNGTTTYTVTVTPQNGFNATVVLALGSLPAGVSGTFSPLSITASGTSTLTITTSGATPGNSTFNVIGTAQTDSQTATANLSVVDFMVSASPASQTLAQGGTITYTVTTAASNGFSDPITLSVSGLPAGVSGLFNPNPVTGAGTSTLILTALANAQLGSAPLTINGTSRGVTHNTGVALTVNPPPSISSLSPAQAPVGGVVTISGNNFNASQGDGTVTVGGVLTAPSSWSNTSIVFSVPPSLGIGNAAVVVSVNGAASNSVNLSVTPGITSISPVSGPVGSAITISGTNFGATQGSSSVSIGGLPATVTGWSNASISASVPLGLGLGNATVVVTEGGLASNSVNFNVTPGITNLSPNSGPIGTAVAISGSNFGGTQGSSTVTFGGTLATVTSWSNNSVGVIAPGLSIGPVSVIVTVNSVASNAVTYTFAPGISSLSPSSGPVGTAVTINGSDFGGTQGSSTVTVGGASVTPTSWSNANIGINVPSSLGVGPAPVVVTVAGVSSTGVNFTVTPGITSFSPASGPVGALVTIGGTNFGATQGSSTVTFGGISTIPTSWSANSITVPVPNGALAGNSAVVITVNGFSSPGVNFSVTPGITNLTPSSGPVGTSVTIAGTSFGATQGASTVTVGGVTSSPASWSSTSVKVPVPASLSLGPAPVVVTVAGLSSTSVNFTVTPGISSLSPSSTPVGTSVTISGTNFGGTQGASTVTIAGLTVTPTNWSTNAVGFVMPSSLGLGAAPVVVTVGGAASNIVNLTVIPGITSLSPASGALSTSVTINGTNFGASQGASTVTFGGSPITPSNWSNGAVGIVVPNIAPGNDNIVVTVSGLSSNVATFTVTPVISSLSLISGPAGSSTTITGSNFGGGQGSSSVTFAGITATVTSWSTASIGVTIPSGLGPGSSPVIVTVNGAASNTSFFTATPSLSSLSPNSGTTGTTVTISGGAFGSTQGSSTVTFNGVSAPVTSWANTTVVVKVPTTATSGNVVITVNSIPSNGAPFTVYSPTVYFQTAAASSTPGLFQLQTTTPTSPTSILSVDLINQPAGEYLIEAFDTQAGVPNSSATWQAGLNVTFAVYMNQAAGTTGTLFPDVKLFLNSVAGTPICSSVSATALTTTQTLYTLNCAPAGNITLSPSDRFYLWVGVSSTATSSASEKVQLTVGPPSRGKQGGNVSVPVR